MIFVRPHLGRARPRDRVPAGPASGQGLGQVQAREPSPRGRRGLGSPAAVAGATRRQLGAMTATQAQGRWVQAFVPTRGLRRARRVTALHGPTRARRPWAGRGEPAARRAVTSLSGHALPAAVLRCRERRLEREPGTDGVLALPPRVASRSSRLERPRPVLSGGSVARTDQSWLHAHSAEGRGWGNRPRPGRGVHGGAAGLGSPREGRPRVRPPRPPRPRLWSR